MIRCYKTYGFAFVLLLSGSLYPMHELMKKMSRLSLGNRKPEMARNEMAYDLEMAWQGDCRPKPQDAKGLLRKCGDGNDAACQELRNGFLRLLAAQEEFAQEVGHKIESVARHEKRSESLKAFTQDLDRQVAAINRKVGDPNEVFVCFNGDMTAYLRPFGAFTDCESTWSRIWRISRRDPRYFISPAKCRDRLLNYMMALSWYSLKKIDEIEAAKK